MNIQPLCTNNFKDLFPAKELPKAEECYKAPNDFGRVIQELLFARSNVEMSQAFLRDVKLVAENEGFHVRESREPCPVRDYRVMISNTEFLSPTVVKEVEEAAARCMKRATYCNDHGHMLRSDMRHGVEGPGAVAVEGKAIVLRNVTFPSELPPAATTQPSPIYFEGGNQFIVTGPDGKKKVIWGEDNVTITHQVMRMTGLFKNPSNYFDGKIPEMVGEIGKKIRVDSKTVNGTLAEMASMGLISREFTVTEQTTAIAVNYLAQKQFVEEIFIPKQLKVEPNQMIYLPQIDYHEDCLMAPGPNGTVLMQDYRLSVTLLESVKRELTDPNDRDLIDKFIVMTKADGQRVQEVMQKAKQKLEKAGFTVIATPGAFFAPSKSNEKQMVNFFNAITGFSPKTNRFYYIVGGTSVGNKLGGLLMDAYAQFLQSLCKVNVYYVGRNSKNPADFSFADHVLNNLDAMMGVHCLSLETKI